MALLEYLGLAWPTILKRKKGLVTLPIKMRWHLKNAEKSGGYWLKPVGNWWWYQGVASCCPPDWMI